MITPVIKTMMESELKRGTLELVLLHLLSEREMYGYEIISALTERSEGRFEIKDGTLYPVLYRLEKAEHVEPYWQTRERGVPRKYYGITSAGRQELDRLRREWQTFASTVTHLIQTGARHE